ncbi:V-type proton ATPase subunit F [Capsicum annuum]|nr:V-type proton ATPase subunit F [Capsicum annuum]
MKLVMGFKNFKMANRAPVRTNNSALIAMIADEDTITGFLLAGVGNVDLRRKTNYLIVDSRRKPGYLKTQYEMHFCEIIDRRKQALVFPVSGKRFSSSSQNSRIWEESNIDSLCSETTVKQIEDAFKDFTTREDIAIVLISQYVANMVRFLVDSYNKPIPAILEIPSKDHPYDPAHDSVLSRVKYLFSTESVASDRR